MINTFPSYSQIKLQNDWTCNFVIFKSNISIIFSWKFSAFNEVHKFSVLQTIDPINTALLSVIKQNMFLCIWWTQIIIILGAHIVEYLRIMLCDITGIFVPCAFLTIKKIGFSEILLSVIGKLTYPDILNKYHLFFQGLFFSRTKKFLKTKTVLSPATSGYVK